MANFNGRRAPNFAQYLDDLNTIPSPYDQAVQQRQQENTFNLDEELALFTNTEFFDFDKFTDLGLPTFDAVDQKSSPVESIADQSTQNADIKFLEFLNDGLGNMPEYQHELNGLNASIPVQHAPYAAVPSVSHGPVAANSVPAQNVPIVAPPSVAATPVQNALSPDTSAAPAKRKSTSKASPTSAEEASRVMAEEDKRRRNTAASARFRVKKKMREQALERSLKETNDKNDALEARVSQLELENHWLRGLIMEKNGTKERNEASEKAISDMFKNFLASRKTDSSLSESKHGVGTFA
ncbi:hypothetical protein PMG11_10502 [Penicillium brasilianum]|uniref:BZIP domain-containing protein n=1 Tax=Penicillium brasilianum TaxID=104259 RepID=A0A0F7U1A2_PENBI|nr:hypothetical protein PMG11_10502 [Penicillium brasilianum]